MARGRPVDPARRLDGCEGSLEAKKRAKTVAAYLAGELSVKEVRKLLGVGESQVHDIVKTTLQAMIEANEFKPAGRPRETTEADRRVAELEAENQQLEQELRVARILGERPWAPLQRRPPKRR